MKNENKTKTAVALFSQMPIETQEAIIALLEDLLAEQSSYPAALGSDGKTIA